MDGTNPQHNETSPASKDQTQAPEATKKNVIGKGVKILSLDHGSKAKLRSQKKVDNRKKLPLVTNLMDLAVPAWNVPKPAVPISCKATLVDPPPTQVIACNAGTGPYYRYRLQHKTAYDSYEATCEDIEYLRNIKRLCNAKKFTVA